MHLALISTLYYPRMRGGAEHSLQLLAEALVRKGVRVSTLSLNGEHKEERYTHNGVECRSLPVPNLARCLDTKNTASGPARLIWHVRDIYNPEAGRLLEWQLHDLKPDIVQTHNLPGWSCSAWSAARRLGLPHIQVLHDFQLTCPTTTRFREGKNCGRTCAKCQPFASLRRRFSQRVSHVVANSHYTRQLHRDLGFFSSASVFDVIYGAVPPPAIPRTHVARPESPLRIGYIGRLHPTKGVDLLITAFLSAARKDAVLRIAGTGTADYEAQLRQQTAGHAVEFLGHTTPADFFPTIDVLVVPSIWNEPMGRVVIEAATHGVPVIAAARGGIPELVQEGRTGWLFDPAVPGQLTGRLAALDTTQFHVMHRACQEWGGAFSPETISNNWLSLYRRLLAVKSGKFKDDSSAAGPQTTKAIA